MKELISAAIGAVAALRMYQHGSASSGQIAGEAADRLQAAMRATFASGMASSTSGEDLQALVEAAFAAASDFAAGRASGPGGNKFY